MSRNGNGYDNAMMELFRASLKKELAQRQGLQMQSEALRAIFEHIEVFCNLRVRGHASLGCQSPVNSEMMRN